MLTHIINYVRNEQQLFLSIFLAETYTYSGFVFIFMISQTSSNQNIVVVDDNDDVDDDAITF